MEIVDLLSYMYSEGFYFWGLVLAGQATDFLFEEMVMEVMDFDFDFDVGFDVLDSAEDFVEEESLNMLDMRDKRVDINNIGRTFHMDFVLLVPKVEIDFEIGSKVVAKSSNLVGVDCTFDY